MDERQSRGAEAQIDRDTALRLLSHTYRRALLARLESADATLPLADAAEAVVRRSDTRSIDEISADETERVSLALHHSHIPKLADEGVVAYDRDRSTVELTARGEALVSVQRRLPRAGTEPGDELEDA